MDLHAPVSELSSQASREERLRWILKEHQATEIEGFVVDVVTANMLLSIADKLNEQNRGRFLRLSLPRAVEVGWKLVQRSQEDRDGRRA
jgi:hypothetical protein